jgi:hypothetical protein
MEHANERIGYVVLIFYFTFQIPSMLFAVGVDINNCVKIQALLELLYCEKKHNIGSLQVFGDSKLVID